MSNPRPTPELIPSLLPTYETFINALQNNSLLRYTYKIIVLSHQTLSAEAALDKAWVFEKIRITLEKHLKIKIQAEDNLLIRYLEKENHDEFYAYILAFYHGSAQAIDIDAFKKEFLEQYDKKKRVDSIFKSCYSSNDIQFFTSLHETLNSLLQTQAFENSINARNEKQAADIKQIKERIRNTQIEHPIQTLNRLADAFKNELQSRIRIYENNQLNSITINPLIITLETKANTRITHLENTIKRLEERATNWPENDGFSIAAIQHDLKYALNKDEKAADIIRLLKKQREKTLADIDHLKKQLQLECKHDNTSMIYSLKHEAAEQKIEFATAQLPDVKVCIEAITNTTAKAIRLGIDNIVSNAINSLSSEIVYLSNNSYDKDIKRIYETTFGTPFRPLLFKQFDQLVNATANIAEFKAKTANDAKQATAPGLLQPKSIHESLAEKKHLIKCLIDRVTSHLAQKQQLHEMEIKQLTIDLNEKSRPAIQFFAKDINQQLVTLNNEEKQLCEALHQFYAEKTTELKSHAREHFNTEWQKRINTYNQRIAFLKNTLDAKEDELRRNIKAFRIEATVKKLKLEADETIQREAKSLEERRLAEARDKAEKAAATVTSIMHSPTLDRDKLLLARNEAAIAEQKLAALNSPPSSSHNTNLGLAITIGLIAPLALFYGGYLLATYATQSKIAGFFLAIPTAIITLFMYPWWIGVKTAYYNNASEYTRDRNEPMLNPELTTPLLSKGQRSSSHDDTLPSAVRHITLPAIAPINDHTRINETEVPLLQPKTQTGIVILHNKILKRTYVHTKPRALFQADGKRKLHIELDEKISRELGAVASKLLADITRLVKHPDDLQVHGIVHGGWLKITVNDVDFHILPDTIQYHAVLQKISGHTITQINYSLFNTDEKLLNLLYPPKCENTATIASHAAPVLR